MDKSKFVKAIMQPNLWLQKLSTREPSLDMLEVSINAFQVTMLLKEDQASHNHETLATYSAWNLLGLLFCGDSSCFLFFLNEGLRSLW